MNDTRDPYPGLLLGTPFLACQCVHEEYEPGQLDYRTGLPIQKAVRLEYAFNSATHTPGNTLWQDIRCY